MNKIFTLMSCILFAWSAAAQDDLKKAEPTLAPMEDLIVISEPAADKYEADGVEVYYKHKKVKPDQVRRLFDGTPAYEEYLSALRYNRVGKSLLWPGVGVTAAGGLFTIISLALMVGDDYYFSFWAEGGAVGVSLLAVGVPLVAVGSSLRGTARRKVESAVGMYNDYMSTSSRDYAPELLFGFTSGGIGLVLKF